MRKPGIPPVPRPDESRERFDSAVKESIEIFKGDRKSRIATLDSTATTEQIALKINEILALLQ